MNTPHPTDIHVGKRLRTRRYMLGLTQNDIAVALGIKFQQVQKYETGANRISASRLHDAAKALRVPTSYFFEGLEGQQSDTLAAATTDEAQLLRNYRAAPEPIRRATLNVSKISTATAA